MANLQAQDLIFKFFEQYGTNFIDSQELFGQHGRMNNSPIFSIIIATFNSEKMLPRVFDSIIRQTLDIHSVEVLLVDGRSKDATRNLVEKYPFARVVDNPHTDPVNAKYIGYKEARGKYVVYLDHDEVLESPNSLEKKNKIFESFPDVVSISTSGYKNPEGYPFLNQYLNDFGDPFSAYFYDLSKDYRVFIDDMKRRYTVAFENDDFIRFSFKSNIDLPLIELAAAGAAIRKSYLEKRNVQTKEIPLIFQQVIADGCGWGITKHDPLVHYSSESFAKYKNKIKWRIKNNIFGTKDLGEAGFSGRERDASIFPKLKKYLFIPYSLLILPSLAHSLWLGIKRRHLGYLIHFPLSFYTGIWILAYYWLKTIGYHPAGTNYDGSKK